MLMVVPTLLNRVYNAKVIGVFVVEPIYQANSCSSADAKHCQSRRYVSRLSIVRTWLGEGSRHLASGTFSAIADPHLRTSPLHCHAIPQTPSESATTSLHRQNIDPGPKLQASWFLYPPETETDPERAQLSMYSPHVNAFRDHSLLKLQTFRPSRKPCSNHSRSYG